MLNVRVVLRFGQSVGRFYGAGPEVAQPLVQGDLCKATSETTTSLQKARAAAVLKRAIQRDHEARAATKMRNAHTSMINAMVNAKGTCMRRNGRWQRTTDRSPDKTRNEDRDVKTTGGACCGVVCWFRWTAIPDPLCGKELEWWHGDVAGVCMFAQIKKSCRSGEKTTETAVYGRSRCVLGSGRGRPRPGWHWHGVRRISDSVGAREHMPGTVHGTRMATHYAA